MRKKFYFEIDWLLPFIPEAEQLKYLPRKKKKRLKKYISLRVSELLHEFAKTGKLELHESKL
jgi:hypothetical protein